MPEISLRGLDKAEVIAALFNASVTLHSGFHQRNIDPMSVEEARALLKEAYDSPVKRFMWVHDRATDRLAYERLISFDYIRGRFMRVDFLGDILHAEDYDRINGIGAAEKVVNELRLKKGVNSDYIKRKHAEGTLESTADARRALLRTTKVNTAENIMTLGLGDLKESVAPGIERSEKQARETLAQLKSKSISKA